MEGIEAAIQHSFAKPELLERALTHKSRTYELSPDDPLANNEQLEFLGDSILGFLASEELILRFPGSPEGRLSKLKAHLVSASHLSDVAQALNFGKYILLGRGEELSGGREKKALLANALEAVIAAIYLDGGIDAARRFVVQYVLADLQSLESMGSIVADYKSALQELAQELNLSMPRYVTLEERGPQHAKTFVVEVRIGRDCVTRAEGASKKSAGQRAAQQALRELEAGVR